MESEEITSHLLSATTYQSPLRLGPIVSRTELSSQPIENVLLVKDDHFLMFFYRRRFGHDFPHKRVSEPIGYQISQNRMSEPVGAGAFVAPLKSSSCSPARRVVQRSRVTRHFAVFHQHFDSGRSRFHDVAFHVSTPFVQVHSVAVLR